MSIKWLDLAKQKLDPKDRIQREYQVQFDGKTGWLVMSFRKLLFVEERGFLRKKYNLLLDLPYENIDNIALERNQLVITDSENRKHICTTEHVNISKINESLTLLIEQIQPKILTQQ